MERPVRELEAEWDQLQSGINKIIRALEVRELEAECYQEIDSFEYMKIYNTIHTMCSQKAPHNYSRELYERYTNVLKQCLRTKVVHALRETYNNEFMLRELVKRWKFYKTVVSVLSHLFINLDRFHARLFKLPTLEEVGLDCFRESIYSEMKNTVKDAVIALINKERQGEQIDRALIKSSLEIFVAMGHYETDIETPMLLDTAAYYSRKASSWIQGGDTCPDYMLKAEECLGIEKLRVQHYLVDSIETKLLEIVRNELLLKYAQHLLEKPDSGCHALLRDHRKDDLSRMYRLFCWNISTLETIRTIFRQHVAQEGASLVQQAQDAHASEKKDMARSSTTVQQVFILKVIELHEKHEQYVSECFVNHSLFRKALIEAFEIILDKTVVGDSTSAEMLAITCDNLIRRDGNEKQLSDEAVEETLFKVVNLLLYVNDKDEFAELYRRKLGRRLLSKKLANEDHERSVLRKMKRQYGVCFTFKMEGMVTDFTLARETQTAFEEYLKENPQSAPGTDLTVKVLRTGTWPSYKLSNLSLPLEMAKCVSTFKGFYETKTNHQGRKLTWIASLGTCNIVGKFDSKEIELVVSTYQAAVLILFNGADRLSYTEIRDQLNLADEDLVRLLYSFSCAKFKILNKEPNTKNISRSDVFQFNCKFTDKMGLIKIPLEFQKKRPI